MQSDGKKKKSIGTLYEKIMNLIKEDIVNKVYVPGDRIPSETELCNKYEASRITIRKAIEGLENQGLLTRVHGKGTFVRRGYRKDISLLDIGGFGNGTGDKREALSKKVISKKIVRVNKDSEVARAFDAESDIDIVELVRYVYDRNTPFAVDYGYFPLDLYPNIETELDNFDSTFEMLKVVYNVIFKRVVKTIEFLPITTSQLTTQERDYLSDYANEGIVSIKKTIYDYDNRPVHYSHFYLCADSVKFSLEYIRD